METETVDLVQNSFAGDLIKGICSAAQGVVIVILHNYEELLWREYSHTFSSWQSHYC